MTFKQAQKQLKKIAAGRYHAIKFSLTTYNIDCGGNNVECGVYIDGYGHHSGVTWEAAFESLTEEMNPPNVETEAELLKMAP